MNFALLINDASKLVELALLFYLGFGVLFALIFVLFLTRIIDVHARNSSFGFKLMILPASSLLWPLVMPVTIAKLALLLREKILAERKPRQLGGKTKMTAEKLIAKAIKTQATKPKAKKTTSTKNKTKTVTTKSNRKK